LNVVLCHYVAHFMPNLLGRNYPDLFPSPRSPSGSSLAFEIAQSPPVSLLYCGHFAVSIFFALSGYVLALPWHHESSQHRTLLQTCYSSDEQSASVVQGKIITYNILRRRLWGRFLRLHIPAAASMLFAYVLILVGAYDSIVTPLRPEATSHWVSLWSAIPRNSSTVRIVPALLGGELLSGNVELNPIMWTLQFEFWGSIVVLFYTLAVEPCPPPSSSPSMRPLHRQHAEEKPRGYVSMTTFENLKQSAIAFSFSRRSTTESPRTSDGSRSWWLQRFVTISFAIALVSAVCDAEKTLVISVMLLGAHIPSMPRLSKHAAWCLLALAAYLGAFQYDRGMYMSSKHLIDGQEDAARHPITYLLGGRLRAKHVFNSAGALLVVTSVAHGGAASQFFSSRLALYLGRVSFPVYLVHAQVLLSVGGNLFLWLPETICGFYAAPYIIVFFIYLLVTYVLASTIFLEIDKKAISVSRVVVARLLSNQFSS